MSPAPKPAAPATWQCRYCLTSQVLRGNAPQTCVNCGAVETDQATLIGDALRKPPSTRVRTARARTAALILCALMTLAGLSIYLWLFLRTPTHHAEPIVEGNTETSGSRIAASGNGTDTKTASAAGAAQVASVGDTRIVTVTNPHIRTIPKGVDYEPEDLLRSANNAPPASFDTRQFRIIPPRRLRDEEGETVWLGEVVNTSTTQAAICPTVGLTLVRGGQALRHAEHVFPDIPPGAHVPVFFRFGDSPLPFDSMRFEWKPAQAYRYGDDTHPQLTATVATREVSLARTTVNFTREYSYPWDHVTGTILNQGSAPARKFDLYIVLRDAAGNMTGYTRTTRTEPIAPGGKATFNNGAAQWDRPIASVDVLALPSSPPLF